jgi:hypothetical protein
LACADAGSVAENLLWIDWRAGKAKGDLTESDCVSTCVGGTKHTYAGAFRFYAIRAGRYTMVEITFASGGPHGEKTRTQNL